MTTEPSQGPESGVVPHLVVKGANAAIDFYKRAFAAEELMRMPADDGKRLMHAHLRINEGSVMLADDFPEYHDGKEVGAPNGVTLHLQVDDVDNWTERARDAGATVTMPPSDMFWGDRYGQVKDPFGHIWSISSHIKGAK